MKQWRAGYCAFVQRQKTRALSRDLKQERLEWLKPHVRESGSVLVRAKAMNGFSK
jgi:hypothetical protein